MINDLKIIVETQSELREKKIYRAWEDPEQIACMSKERRAAILTNPLSRNEDNPVQLIAIISNRVVGRRNIFWGEVFENKLRVRLPIIWSSNFFVSPSYRKRGIGKAIQLKLESLHHTIASCGVSQKALPIYPKLGYAHFQLPRWLLLLRSRPVIDKYLKKKIPSVLITPIADLFLNLHNTIKQKGNYKSIKNLFCEEINQMPDRFDDNFLQTSTIVSCHRSASWINWLLNNSTSYSTKNKQSLFLIYNTYGEVVAYFLNKIRFYPVASNRGFPNVTIGSLADFFIFEPKKVTTFQIILLAIKELIKYDIDVIEILATSSKVNEFTKKIGFHRMDSLNIVFKASKQSLLADTKYYEQTSWRITPAEGDNFFY